ncbi:hypothetical protein [Streptomyces sp. MMS20-AI2-20]|uniref:hypothetical protein n=1 Tax=Streptomyces sp. MMS20-AI2-20 TaxID=2925835 RepID=UPI001F6180FD|nr:hypothetical protein [Streptomyces sp. MMS20-AI2-20]MCI4142252.1 hypothetical protein [Streptomyces sp. MMS20-AI2-20]
MSRNGLVQAIEQAIGALQPVYRNNADESDLYEASLLVVCVEAARAAGGSVLLTQDGTNPATALRFRRSPGNLWSGDFTYAMVRFPGLRKQLEIHLGVYVAAPTSKVAHECDVAVLDQQEAERSRRAMVHPRSRGLVAAIEAKCYSISPSLGVGRGFLGLAQELGGKKLSLVFPSQRSDTLGALIAKKDSEAYPQVFPGTTAAARLRSRLDQAIRNWMDQL